MRPVIAIPKLGPGLLRRVMGRQFVTALRQAGAEVRWIGPEELDDAAACDGLLLPGGDDILPSLYGQEKSPDCGQQNPLRDELDPALLTAFLPTGKPILGVCRGMQMINVFRGGTLHQDIKAIQKINHREHKLLKEGVHSVTVTGGTLLHSILGQEEISVNTLHHQAVDRVGDGLVVSAVSPDGLVEAVELPGHPFLLGVQWHPEHMRTPEQKQILHAFVRACEKNQ